MTHANSSSATEFLLGAQEVLAAGRQLQSRLDAGPAARRYAINRLERVATQQEASSATFYGFLDTESDRASPDDRRSQAQAIDEILAGIGVDLQVAEVMLAAGQAVGEVPGDEGSARLDEALRSLGAIARRTESPPATQGSEQPDSVLYEFRSEVSPPPTIRSESLQESSATFKSRVDDVLSALIADARDVTTDTLKALALLKSAEVLDGIMGLGERIQGVPEEVGRLFKIGLQKVQQALNALVDLLGNEFLSKVKEHVQQLWKDVTGGKHVDTVLTWTFGIDTTRQQATDVLERHDRLHATMDQASSDRARDTFDRASNDLGTLRVEYRKKMELADRIRSILTRIVTWVGPVLVAATTITGPQIQVFAASAYAVVLGGVVLIGLDYADAGPLQRARGVRQVVASIPST